MERPCDRVASVGRRSGFKESAPTHTSGYLWTIAAISFTPRHVAVYLLELGAFLAPNPILFAFRERVMPLLGLLQGNETGVAV